MHKPGGGFYDEEWEQPPDETVVSIDPRSVMNGAVKSGVILPNGVVAGAAGPTTFIDGRPVVYLNPDGTVGNVKQVRQLGLLLWLLSTIAVVIAVGLDKMLILWPYCVVISLRDMS